MDSSNWYEHMDPVAALHITKTLCNNNNVTVFFPVPVVARPTTDHSLPHAKATKVVQAGCAGGGMMCASVHQDPPIAAPSAPMTHPAKEASHPTDPADPPSPMHPSPLAAPLSLPPPLPTMEIL